MINRVFVAVAAMVICSAVAVCAEDDGIPQAKKQIMPKVPSRGAILKPSESESNAIGTFVRNFIAAKEKKADAELDVYKKTVLEEERVRQADERNRLRRQERNDLLNNTPGVTSRERGPIRIQLDFQVPEIAIYQLAAELCRSQQKLANDVVDALSRMDRDNDGKLSNEEYKEASALVVSTRIVQQKLDIDNDGMISEEELDALRKMPASVTAAIGAGREATSALTFKLKGYDTDGNNVLDVDERKRMVMSFVEATLRAEQEAQFYKSVADNLATARTIVAEKFADVLIAP